MTGIRLRRPVLFEETGLSRERIKSLQIIIYAIALGTVCFNITGGIAMTGYLKTLGVSDFTFGLLFAINPAAGVLQILASYIMERSRKRKAIFMIGGFLTRIIWLPFGLVPFFVPMSAYTIRIWIISLIMLVYGVSNQFLSVSYNSLLADIIPLGIRGSYLGMRGRVSSIMGVLGGFLTAWLLDSFPGLSGYAFVFALAALLGSIDISLFFAVEFPPMPVVEQKDSIRRMLSDTIRNKKFQEIAIFVTIWHFSLNLSAPFYMVYMRMFLEMSNTTITLIANVLPSICTVIILSYWGRMIDKQGIRNAMFNIGRLASIAPLLWLFITPGPFSLILITLSYVSTGFLLQGMEVGSQSAILNRSPERNRSMYIALFHCVNTLIGGALANAVGGWLLDNPLLSLEQAGIQLFGATINRYNYLFLLTFILRATCAFIILPRLISPDDKAADQQ